MPWFTPTLKEVRQMVRDDGVAALRGARGVGNKVLRIIWDTQAGVARLCLEYVDWVRLQLLPDTAETEWLDRHGDIWLVNSDGSTGRKEAVLARGTATFTGLQGLVIPEFTQLQAGSLLFETLENITLGSGDTVGPIRALTPGAIGNLRPDDNLSFVTPLADVDSKVTVVDVRGGADDETDADLRSRVLFRIRKPPMGGDADDYEAWARAIPAVTRAWAAPREMGMGTVTVRFMMDFLRADVDGFPLDEDVAAVKAYIDTKRPVAIKDFFVEAPTRENISFTLHLVNDTSEMRAEVEKSVAAMLFERAKPSHALNGDLVPAQTIYAGWVAEAIGRVTGASGFTLTMADHPMPDNGKIAVLGTVTYA